MPLQFTEVFTQGLVVMDSRDTSSPSVASSTPDFAHGAFETRSLLLRTNVSTMPAIWDFELQQSYHELGEALSELTELSVEDEWGIEPAVYVTASYIANELAGYGLPAPRVFNHGSKSVVFNWTVDKHNAYLTISADRVSALITSPEKIQRRVEYSASRIDSPTTALLSTGFPVWSRAMSFTNSTSSDTANVPVLDWHFTNDNPE